jgi:hypothetical protein
MISLILRNVEWFHENPSIAFFRWLKVNTNQASTLVITDFLMNVLNSLFQHALDGDAWIASSQIVKRVPGFIASKTSYSILQFEIQWQLERATYLPKSRVIQHASRFYGTAVSTLDFESRNLSSNPGRTFLLDNSP